MSRAAITAWAAAPLLALLMGWFGPVVLDDHRAEWDQSADLQAAINTAVERQRFERAAQALCGPQAVWEQVHDGSVQCRTKRGRPTITVRVSP
jgi:hypothetical protein